MKTASTLSTLVLGLSSLVSAGPILSKRSASYDDTCTIGYCTLGDGTTGGSGGTVTEVSTLDDLVSAVEGDESKIVVITSSLSSDEDEGYAVKPGANTSIFGSSDVTLTNIGIRILDTENVIVRNLKIEKVLASTDAIAIQASNNVWIDHCELSSDRDHDKDYYDGLLDITHAADYVTVSNNYLHDHWKASLVGHSDSNEDEDSGHLTVTYFYNFFENLNSRGPSFRFGTGHIFNNYYSNMSDGINTRDGAQLLVENNVFVDSDKPLYSTDDGYAVASGNDFGDGENTAEEGTLTTMSEYDYDLIEATSVTSYVESNAGAVLSLTDSKC
ncbi:MAG: hypothetical protein M1834_005925 [Cirrosporium novae-zelandiae]|nr:MAG: hypothetical protein M1834_005925 [Cirrosporium novae-zelandiae]